MQYTKCHVIIPIIMDAERQRENFNTLLRATSISTNSNVVRITTRQLQKMGIDREILLSVICPLLQHEGVLIESPLGGAVHMTEHVEHRPIYCRCDHEEIELKHDLLRYRDGYRNESIVKRLKEIDKEHAEHTKWDFDVYEFHIAKLNDFTKKPSLGANHSLANIKWWKDGDVPKFDEARGHILLGERACPISLDAVNQMVTCKAVFAKPMGEWIKEIEVIHDFVKGEESKRALKDAVLAINRNVEGVFGIVGGLLEYGGRSRRARVRSDIFSQKEV